jgi:uncharacterized protein
LIGRALCNDLASDGHDVIALSRSPQKKHTGLLETVQCVGWDARTANGWGHLADGADAIVNFAGEGLADGRWTTERKNRIRTSRINAGKAVVEAVLAAKTKPRVVVQASAVGFYGPRGQEAVDERASPGTDFLAQICFDWEASTAIVEQQGVRRSILRTGVVLSLAGGAFPRLALPFKLFVGGPLGSGRQCFPWIHLADQVRAIRFLIDHEGATGPFNLAAPHPLTNAEFGRSLGRVMGRPSIIPVPGLALKLLFGEMATVLLDGQCAVPRRLLDAGFEFQFSTAEEALRDLLVADRG